MTNWLNKIIRNNKTVYLSIVASMIMVSCQNDPVATQKTSDVKTENLTKNVAVKSEVKPIKKEEPKKERKVEQPKVEKGTTEVKKVVNKKPTTKKPTAKSVVNKPVVKKAPAKNKKVTSSPAPAPVEEPQAIISFDRMNHSFGEIKSGDTYDHKFYFTNTGNTDLIIEKATATCGCTQPSFPFIPIAPGEKGFIGVNYNSVGKDGPQRPKVTVYTNTVPAIYNIYLEGTVSPKEEEEKK